MVEGDTDLQRAAELFLYREAKLLDDGAFDDWLALFTDDVRYHMPITESLAVGSSDAPTVREWAIVEDGKAFLAQRCRRLAGRFAHSEQPRSRTRRFISNVLAARAGEAIAIDCNFIVFQSRTDSETFFVGSREDRIVVSDGAWLIAERRILLAHRVLPRAVSVFL